MATSTMCVVDYISEPISYKQFYHGYILQNKPCILSPIFSNSWPCRKNWVCENQLNIDYIEKVYGDLVAPVVDCGKKYFSAHEKYDMKVRDYCNYWRNRKMANLYLKDWHLQRNTSEHLYTVPEYFMSDWLNEYWDNDRSLNDDYRFVYVGTKGTWTPFHADVFHSFSWSANICGLKKWLLYPPGQEEYLKDRFGNLPYDVTVDVDHTMYPKWSNAMKPLEIIQAEGEIIFIPSCWHHQVFNLKDTISINHNWINAASIEKMFLFLIRELNKVKIEIADCKAMDGFHEQCQLILQASAGINLPGFFDMLECLTRKRLNIAQKYLEGNAELESLKTLLNSLHISSIPYSSRSSNTLDVNEQIEFMKFDLSKLKSLLDAMLSDNDFQLSVCKMKLDQGSILISDIDCALKSM